MASDANQKHVKQSADQNKIVFFPKQAHTSTVTQLSCEIEKESDCQMVETIKVGKLTFIVRSNKPSPQAIQAFNECFNDWFERTLAEGEQDDALSA